VNKLLSIDNAGIINIGGLTKTPLILHRVIVNRQCGSGKFKYVPKFCIGGTGQVISRMRNDDLHWTGSLEPNISKTFGDRDLVPMEHQ